MACLPEYLLHWLQTVQPGPLKAQAIDPDGSSRSFYRLDINGRRLVLLHSPYNLPESMAWLNFNRHLATKGIPVPDIVAARPEAGWFLMRDMGETSLQQAAQKRAGQRDKLLALYQPVLQMLARLQAFGLQGLDAGWCFDSQALDTPFLREREMGYFFRQVVQGYSLSYEPGLFDEFDLIARRAAAARPWGLVHRDMQSRNIVLDDNGRLGVVDFQGARPGPAQYDLASLLNDPYVDLPRPLRAELLAYYMRQLRELLDFDEREFLRGLPWVALSRNLQALAAYVFLSREKGKKHFIAYLAPAVRNLAHLLGGRQLSGLKHLCHIAGQLQAIYY